MFPKFLLTLVVLLGFCFFAHTQIEKSHYPELHDENKRLASQIDNLTAGLATANKSKDAVTAERDKAVEELNQIKALVKVASTQPSVIKK